MDWRKYFTPSEFVVEKINTRHKPRGASGGQFDRKNGWDLLGHTHTGSEPSASGTRVDFTKLGIDDQDSIVKTAILTRINRGIGVGASWTGGVGRGAGAFSTASDITAAISQSTGTLQGEALSKAVGSSIKRLQAEGKIEISRVTQKVSSEGGHWVFTDVKTGKTIIDPISGKPARGLQVNDDTARATRDIHRITLTTAGKRSLTTKEKEGLVLNQSLSNSRPVKFDPVKGGLADVALSIRQKTFPNSQLAPQGRVHSNDPNAPEMLRNKIKEGTRKPGEKTLKETYPDLAWYDATSSARANVGAMTGDKELLDATRLSMRNPKTPAMATAAKLGLHEVDKPYYALLNPSNGKGTEITKSMVNIGNLANNPEGIKKVVKSVDTPRLYGARATGTVKGATKEILTQAGFDKTNRPTAADKVKATTLATALVKNFEQTPIAQFEAKFKDLAAQAPDNFVYTNPVNGFKMSFQKHDTVSVRVDVKDEKGDPFKIAIRTPGTPSLSKSKTAMMPLFVQSYDAAVKDYVTATLKNPYTKHDAFAVTKQKSKNEGVTVEVEKLKKTVADAYMKINKANPIGDLAAQMKRQHEALIGKSVRSGGTTKRPKYKIYTVDDYNKSVKAINNAVNNFFPNGKPPLINIPPNSGHLEYE